MKDSETQRGEKICRQRLANVERLQDIWSVWLSEGKYYKLASSRPPVRDLV